MKPIKAPGVVHRSKRPQKGPALVLARALEKMLIAAGMPNPYTRAEFGVWHRRLLLTEGPYARGYRLLQQMTTPEPNQ